jgi:hypothetical protein
MMLDLLVSNLSAGRPWNASAYNALLLLFEQNWCEDPNAYSPYPSGESPVDAARKIIELIEPSSDVVGAFVSFPASAVEGHNFPVAPQWSTDPRVLMRVCVLIDGCSGFTSDGFLKRGATSADILPGRLTVYLRTASVLPAENAPGYSILIAAIGGAAGAAVIVLGVGVVIRRRVMRQRASLIQEDITKYEEPSVTLRESCHVTADIMQ